MTTAINATRSGSRLQERQSSPPSSPANSSPVSPSFPSITLSNSSSALVDPTASTSTSTPTRRRRPSNPKSTTTLTRTSTISSTSSRRRLTSTRTSSTSTRPRTRTRTRTSTRRTPTPSLIAPAPASPPPPPSPPPRISNVVHICIARPPASIAGNPLPPAITYTSTATFTNPPERATATRDAGSRTRSRDPGAAGLNGATAITVTDYDCQFTLPLFSRASFTTTTTPSLPTISPSNGLNVDNSTLPPLGPNAAHPTTGSESGDGSLSFFATPGGKGAIAGISIGSAAILLGLILFFLWRKKKDTENQAGVAGAARSRESASSFGDSSGDQGNPPIIRYSPPVDAHGAALNPEMAQIGTGPPGSFFVQRRSQPSSVRGTDTPPRVTHINQLDAATAARAISPLAMLQQRPQAFMQPSSASRAHRSTESNSGENDPSSGSSYGHANMNDPFRDPSSTGHSTNMAHDPSVVASFASDKHERRRSGYTSDTYRKRRSRPVSVFKHSSSVLSEADFFSILFLISAQQLSVRNPDSDETRQQGIESLYMDRTPRSDSSDAIYAVDNDPVPDSSGLEFYLGSAVPTPRSTTPVHQAFSVPQHALPPMPQNTLADNDLQAETPRATQRPPWAAWHDAPLVPDQQQTISAYDGIVRDSQAGPSQSMPEFETHETYAFPQPRAIMSISSASTSSRPQVQPVAVTPHVHPSATAPSNLTRVIEHGSSTRQHRHSISSSDGASSRSSLWRAWEHNNRSWVNDGFETPNDVQDVQLGSNAGAVGGGNATSISGYFAWR